MKEINEYYLGLDMGEGSLGWAVTTPDYHVVKKAGKALWGVRLFEKRKPLVRPGVQLSFSVESLI